MFELDIEGLEIMHVPTAEYLYLMILKNGGITPKREFLGQTLQSIILNKIAST